jgi:hypothetical protein
VAYSTMDQARLAWFVLSRSFAALVFGFVVLYLPQGRMEQLVVLVGAAIWWEVSWWSVSTGYLSVKETQFKTNLLRSVLPHLKDTFTDEEWDQELKRIGDNVPFDDAEYARKYAPHHLRVLRLSDLRVTIEESWLESIRVFRDAQRDYGINGVFSTVQFAILMLSAFRLVSSP